jgi:ribokinase
LLLQREIPEDINIKACEFNKSLGGVNILDMGGEDRPISNKLLNLLDIISPNKTELRRILNKEIDVTSDEEVVKAVEEMRTISDNKNLCLLLKLGSKGCLYVDKDNKILKQAAFNFEDMPIVDTTGAGDCFTASFVTQMSCHKDIEECLRFATAAAYIAITRFGAMPSMPTMDEVNHLLEKLI